MTCKLEFPLWHPEAQLYTPHWLVRIRILHSAAPAGSSGTGGARSGCRLPSSGATHASRCHSRLPLGRVMRISNKSARVRVPRDASSTFQNAYVKAMPSSERNVNAMRDGSSTDSERRQPETIHLDVLRLTLFSARKDRVV